MLNSINLSKRKNPILTPNFWTGVYVFQK